MSASNVTPGGPVALETGAEAGSFRLYRHLVIGLAIALIAPFTALAWPFAILVGIVIGQDDVERRSGIRRSSAVTVLRVLGLAGGVLAMLFFGAIIGGLIAVPIVVLAAFSERAAAGAEWADRVVARLVLIVLPLLAYVALIAAGVNISIRFGA
ncbi:MAG TPA: hypothetical protein VFO05_03255 [Candidatus Limnocylindrales bacterium]|nr:hypothetical protein [Candidatus Limnocylindrales bacterium]